MNILSPSILAADFSRLGASCEEAIKAGSQWLHIDVMDGHFVPNISFGPVVMRGLREMATELGAWMDVHLMIENPEDYLEVFAKAGADLITVHVETCPDLDRTLGKIEALGVRTGVTLRPSTPLSSITSVLERVDLALVMSVEPGFAGQSFIPESLDRIREVRNLVGNGPTAPWIQVDGGVSATNVEDVVAAGANCVVAGSGVFKGDAGITGNVKNMLTLMGEAAAV